MNNEISKVLRINIQRFDDYIERADNKANFILTISGALIVACMFGSKDIISNVHMNELKNMVLLDLFIINCCLIFSIIQALLAIIPRTPKGTYTSKFFFEDVKSFKNDDFYNQLIEENDEILIKDMGKQTVELANICSKKMSKIRNSLYGLGFSLIFIFILAIINMINH